MVTDLQAQLQVALDKPEMGEKAKTIDMFSLTNSDSEQEFEINKDDNSDLSSSAGDEEITVYSNHKTMNDKSNNDFVLETPKSSFRKIRKQKVPLRNKILLTLVSTRKLLPII